MSAVRRVTAAFAAIARSDRPEAWIAVRDEAQALADAHAIDAALAAGQHLPLAGLTLAVKDNIDVAGMDTTAACPSFAYRAARSATAVQRLVDAGMVVIGKTNLDQFATGLVGTRSPYGAVRDARRPEYISGGSSSGSAVAVALGLVDAALGTDTAGSGRVPAAFQGIVGLKPTLGVIPTDGVVPACRSFDSVSVFARTVDLAQRIADEMAQPAPHRPFPADAPLAAAPRPTVAVPTAAGLRHLTPAARAAFARVVAELERAGTDVREVDVEPLLQAGRLLYDGAFVAERHAAVGEFVAAGHPGVDPTVASIVDGAAALVASSLVADQARLEDLARQARAALGADALLMPTTTRQPTIAQVAADPLGANSALGVYTTFVNLLDLCAVAVPAGMADDGHFGVTIIAPAFCDRLACDLARRLAGEPSAAGPAGPPEGVDLLVVGAHLAGQPLNHQLVQRGARLEGPARTAPYYRLYRLDGEPPRPGMVRAGDAGASIPGELWRLPPAGLGTFLAALPPPMTLGHVALDDGREVVGFLCEPYAIADAPEITGDGGWLAHLRTREVPA